MRVKQPSVASRARSPTCRFYLATECVKLHNICRENAFDGPRNDISLAFPMSVRGRAHHGTRIVTTLPTPETGIMTDLQVREVDPGNVLYHGSKMSS